MNIDGLFTTVSPGNGTTPRCDHGNDTPLYWGYITAAIAVICYGTTPTPIKRTHTGNGMFFQWIFGLSTGLYALIIQQIRGNPKFYLLPMLGGVSFITANLTVVPVIKMIGLALMISIRGATNLLSGWATGRFGLFGLKSDPPDNLLLNDLGVILAVLSTVIFAFVNNEVQRDSRKRIQSDIEDTDITGDRSFVDNFSPNARRIGGFFLSLGAGILYAQTFTPFFYVQTYYEGASQNALDYVFSTLCGNVITSTVYFLMYAIYTKNRPKIYPRAIIPAFITGLLWTTATSCWFVSNLILSESVAFPIITTGPAVVANLLGVFVFKEIKGSRNLLILSCGMLVTISGAILTGFSKKSTKC